MLSLLDIYRKKEKNSFKKIKIKQVHFLPIREKKYVEKKYRYNPYRNYITD